MNYLSKNVQKMQQILKYMISTYFAFSVQVNLLLLTKFSYQNVKKKMRLSDFKLRKIDDNSFLDLLV